jgi:hypothetical protein
VAEELADYLGRMAWFFSAPNAIAAAPSALLLPREVVAKELDR